MRSQLAVFDRLLELTVLLQADLESSFSGTGLTTSRTHLLWELHRLGPSTQQRLATALDVSPRNVTGLVDALESHGYLERRPHPTDRRAVLVTLTELGTQAMTTMAADRERAATDLLADLGRAELNQFERTLETVTATLRRLVAAETTTADSA